MIVSGVMCAMAWEVEVQVGAELSQTSAGILNVRAKKENWSFSLLTDTLDVRFEQASSRGRGWAALRGEFGAAGMAHQRWLEGAPAPEASQIGAYVGPEGGWIRYLPHGMYVGFQASIRRYGWLPLAATETLAVGRWVVAPDLVFGVYDEAFSATLRAGAAAGGPTRTMGAHLDLRWTPAGRIRPWMELRAGLADDADIVTATRVGGLNPYVVPLAGAAWGEFWVKDYVFLRAGPRLAIGKQSMSVVADVGQFGNRRAVGFASVNRLRSGPWTFDVAVGWSPWLQREDGAAASAFAMLGYRRH